jgi:hypothetical protein
MDLVQHSKVRRGPGQRVPRTIDRQIERALMRNPTTPDRQLALRFAVDPRTIARRRRLLARAGKIANTDLLGRGRGARLHVGAPRVVADSDSRRQGDDVSRFVPKPGPGVVNVTVSIRYTVPGRPYGWDWTIPLDLAPGKVLGKASRTRAVTPGVEYLCQELANGVAKSIRRWCHSSPWPDPFPQM